MDTARTTGTGRGVPIGEAAAQLGLTTTAVRKRIKRGSLLAAKNEDGTWTVFLDDSPPGEPTGRDAGSPPDSPPADERVALLARENDRLWQELERRSEELRRKDIIIAQFAERLPELPLSTQTKADRIRAGEPASRPWWRFWEAS